MNGPVDIKDVVEACVDVLGSLVKRDVKLITEVSDDLPILTGDAGSAPISSFEVFLVVGGLMGQYIVLRQAVECLVQEDKSNSDKSDFERHQIH